MDLRDRVLDLLDLLYAAPGTDSGWLPFLDAVCASLNASGASFISINALSRANVSTTARTDPDALSEYQTHWGAFDPWGASVRLRDVPSGAVVCGSELIAPAALRRTSFYSEFGRRYDIVRTLVGVVERERSASSVIAINGTERRGEFSEDDAQLLSALMPHIQRSLQLHRRLLDSDARTGDVATAVDACPHAFILVGTEGAVTFMNRVAVRLTAARDGLTVEDGQLRALRSSDTRMLRALIASAASSTAHLDIGPGGVLVLERPLERRPLTVVVAPLSSRRPPVAAASNAAAMIIVSDPDCIQISQDIARALWRLTGAEAQLLDLLVSGKTVAQAATHLGLAVDTVRKRLKGILEKTGTHRQPELVSLALRSAWDISHR